MSIRTRSREIKRRLGIKPRGHARRGGTGLVYGKKRTSPIFADLNLPRFRLPRLRLPRLRFFRFNPTKGKKPALVTSPFRSSGRRMRLPISLRRIKERAFRFSVLIVIILILFGAWQLLRPGIRVRVSPDVVAAFRVPHRAIGLLEDYARRHNISFPYLFAVFNAENDFFPEKSAIYDLSVLEQLYVIDFYRIKRRYNARSLAPYVAMFENLFGEIVAFPIPPGWYDHEPSIMFGDSWGVEHNFQGNRMHMGTAIVDRENIRGRVPIVSMTDGQVEEAGWNNQLGYFVGIITASGTYFLYAHLDSLAHGLTAGQHITAGHSLGYMGNTGGGRGGRSFPVHVHIGISPAVDFARGQFWINPYPFLRHIEGRGGAGVLRYE